MTMQLIETITVGAGGAASIEFTGIPQDADDLFLLVSSRASNASTANNGRLAINGDTATNYSTRRLNGTGTSVSSGTSTSPFIDQTSADTSTANTFGSASIYLTNYTGAQNKVASSDSVSENNATAAGQWLFAYQRNNTDAITSLRYYFGAGNLLEHSTASLYKITKA